MNDPREVVGLWIALVIVVTAGFFVGLRYGQEDVPRCAEDEVLVPDSYPYNSVDHLSCVHIDTLGGDPTAYFFERDPDAIVTCDRDACWSNS